jgi:hypothetical protein
MRKLIIIILGVILFTGCKSFEPKLLNPTAQPLENKLPAVENTVENDLTTMIVVDQTVGRLGPNTQDIKTLFDRQVTEVITNPYGIKKGSLVLKVTTIESRFNGLISAAWCTVLAGVPFLLGAPYLWAESKVEVKLEVLDNNRALIGAYRGSGENRLKSGLYYTKYNRNTLQRVTYVEATKQAINEATKKLEEDVDRLNEELSK